MKVIFAATIYKHPLAKKNRHPVVSNRLLLNGGFALRNGSEVHLTAWCGGMNWRWPDSDEIDDGGESASLLIATANGVPYLSCWSNCCNFLSNWKIRLASCLASRSRMWALREAWSSSRRGTGRTYARGGYMKWHDVYMKEYWPSEVFRWQFSRGGCAECFCSVK